MSLHPLDRAVWNALAGQQNPIALGDARARRFAPDVSPLAAPADLSAASLAAFAALISAGDDISLLERNPPPPPAGLDETLRAEGVQMWAHALMPGLSATGVRIEPLGDADAAEMLALALLTRPGPFRARTHTMGRFIGVRENRRLIAMAGERLHLNGYREVSGVCTHPDARGRGLAETLSRLVAQRILDDGEIPFLHAYANNAPAIAIYQRLGFTLRHELLHCVWRRA